MKKFISIISALALCFCIVGCEDFLDTTNKTKKDTSNFPKNPEDAEQLLVGVYSIMGRIEPLQSTFLIGEIASDNCFGGGDNNDLLCKGIDQFKKSGEDMFRNAWRAKYFGVFRSNFLISHLDDINWDSQEQRDKIEGQVRFLRAFFYYDLSQIFGEVPLVTSPDPVNLPKSPAADTYALIASDLKKAIEMLPNDRVVAYGSDNGRITRWAAEAYMARVFLFYTGYYNQSALPLAEGGEITKAEVVDWIVDCIENSGHELVPEFRNLWPYSHVQDYAYTAENNLHWAGDGNIEEVLAVKYSTLANWDSPSQKSNQYCLYYGVRGQSNYALTYPFGQGWGMGTVNPKLWEEWDDNDIRKRGSILDTQNKSEIRVYAKGGGNQTDETYYMIKKYTPINVFTDETKSQVVNYSVPLYGMTETNFQLTNTQDCVLIRFSDVLLMGAELGAPQAQRYLDRVRERVNLASVPATLDNIKSERRFELAFEGLRYYDLLRWHDEQLITDNQTNIRVFDRRVPQKKNIVFRPETGGFMPIPETEISLSQGVLVQNPGWVGSEHYLN